VIGQHQFHHVVGVTDRGDGDGRVGTLVDDGVLAVQADHHETAARSAPRRQRRDTEPFPVGEDDHEVMLALIGDVTVEVIEGAGWLGPAYRIPSGDHEAALGKCEALGCIRSIELDQVAGSDLGFEDRGAIGLPALFKRVAGHMATEHGGQGGHDFLGHCGDPVDRLLQFHPLQGARRQVDLGEDLIFHMEQPHEATVSVRFVELGLDLGGCRDVIDHHGEDLEPQRLVLIGVEAPKHRVVDELEG
jgi:hypothetical protein